MDFGIDFDFLCVEGCGEGGGDGIGSAKKSNIGAEKVSFGLGMDWRRIFVKRTFVNMLGFFLAGFASTGSISPACFRSKAVKIRGRFARTRKFRFRMNAGTRNTSGSRGSGICTIL